MKRLIRSAPFLKALTRAKTNRVRKKLIGGAKKSDICSICELTKNVYRKRLKASPSQKKKLCKYKRVIRILLDKSVPIEVKQRLMQKGGQKGGLPFIPILASIAAPILSKIFSSFIK